MTGKRQKPLPGFEEYFGKANASLRFPQPRIESKNFHLNPKVGTWAMRKSRTLVLSAR
jgi:hypothetical protein